MRAIQKLRIVIGNNMKARVLLYDIETSPLVTYTWGIWEQNAIEVKEDWQMLCFAYKWLGDKKIHIVSQDDMSDYIPGVNDDRQVVEKLRDLFDEAQVVIAHNGDSFDQKKSQARMMKHNLTPPSPYKQIDTKKVAKKYGAFTSNKLDYLNRTFGFEGKIDTGGFATWKGCMRGDKKAWARMKKYNKKDVEELEKLYLYLRPWIQNHPAMNIMNLELESCPKCGEGPVEARNSPYPTKSGYKQPVWCHNCRGWSNVRINSNLRPDFVN